MFADMELGHWNCHQETVMFHEPTQRDFYQRLMVLLMLLLLIFGLQQLPNGIGNFVSGFPFWIENFVVL
jgi:hypothetical protein